MSPPIEMNANVPSTPLPVVGLATGQVATHTVDDAIKKAPAKPAPKEAPRTAEPVKTDSGMVHLGYTVDHAANALKIKVTNQESGEVVREFEIKGLGSAHHDPVSAKGLVIDNKT